MKKETKTIKTIKYVDGFSESVWKSLVVKSLRIGWVQGIEESAKRLPPSVVKDLLIAGIFEDLFPGSWEELNEEIREINEKDYYNLCSHETHHGRGYTNRFCDMEQEAVKNGRAMGYSIMIDTVRVKSNLKYLSARVFNCLYTWYKISPKDEGVKRTPFIMEFTGIPECIIDSHTYEGKVLGRGALLLSGHYFNHRKIGEEVMKNGWENIRNMVKNGTMLHVAPSEKLF